MLGEFGSRFNNRLIIGRPDSRKQGEELDPPVQCEFMKGFEWRNFQSLGFFGGRTVPHDGVKRVAGASGLKGEITFTRYAGLRWTGDVFGS